MRFHVVLLQVVAFLEGVRPLRTYFSRLTVAKKTVKGRVVQIGVTILLVSSLLMLEAMMGFNYFTYQMLGSLMGIPHLGIFLASLVGFFLTFLIGSIGLSSIVYSGKDIQLLGTLPVSGKELLFSRLLIAYILYSPLYMAVVLPALVAGIFLNGVGFLYLLGSLALLALGPLFPLSLALLAANLLIRLAKGRRYRMLEQLFSFLVMLSFSLAMIATFSRSLEDGATLTVDYQAMLSLVGPIFQRLVALFPLFALQAKALFSWSALMGNLVFLLLFTFGSTVLVSKGYLHTLSLVASAQSSVKKRGQQKSFRQRSVTFTLMKRDLEVIQSQSVFMIELVGELLIPLILLGVYALTGVLGELQGLLGDFVHTRYLPYGIFLAVALFSSICMLSSTSISRQGPLFMLDKIYPLKPEQFVKAKLLLHLLLVGGASLVYLALALLFFRLPLLHILWMWTLQLVVVCTVACFGLAIDYRKPLLEWTIPQQAMKSNLNGLLGLAAAICVIAIVFTALMVPTILFSMPVLGFFLALAASLALCALGWKVCVKSSYVALSR
ncbi:hypothetical protein [Sphaerochaeta sp. PS]|uniref:hypothetical protein n=1 Tax=Sphaerochaeta sp. PS TaxID=3076336 RepID=UPI0028A35490|nr:hypothetical protein [Sphaerochaeta sp. PS]MDT4762892.1 hypothetical protein [Sphaerochaeta sp. PS]